MSSKRCLVLLALVASVQSHNWINMPARGPKVSTAKPCPPRQFLQQKHVQANPGDKIPVEWATGHTMSFGSFVLVAAEDEARLLEYSNAVFDDYYEGAKDAETKYFDAFHVAKSVDVYPQYLRADVEHKCEGIPADRTKLFANAVSRQKAHKRPAGFRVLASSGAEPGFLEYNPAIPEHCRSMRWASRKLPADHKYSWIKAVSGYNVVAHYPADGAISTFQVPSDLPSGKYILHWVWRGYYNCVDTDIVDVETQGKVTDNWGNADPTDMVMTKIDHCQSWKHTDPQAEKKQAIRDAAEKAKPKFAPAKQALAEAEADSIEANQVLADALSAKQSADDRLTEAKAQKREADTNAQSANKEKTAANKLRPKNPEAVAIAASAVDAAQERRAVTKKEQDSANAAKTKSSNAYKSADKRARAKKTTVGSKSRVYNKAFTDYHGRLNAVDWGTSYPFCTIVEASDASACTGLCTDAINGVKAGGRCDSINVVPHRLPSTTAWPGQVNPAIPDQCRVKGKPDSIINLHSGVEQSVPKGARICYALTEGKSTDAGSAFTISSDPEDPVFYSTCFKRQPSADIAFGGPTCGPKCLLPETANVPKWRYGNKCVACEDMKKNANVDTQFVPEWKLTSQCQKCN